MEKTKITDCLIMAKPFGPACNMRCDYCYYIAKAHLFQNGPQKMSDDLLEKYIADRFDVSAGPNTHFEWHGGEPTLLGLDFFRRVVDLQRKYLPEGRTVSNGLQTNGLLIDESWAGFLSREKFSVGLSLDGPKEFHDRYRKTVDNRPTHSKVLETFSLLKEYHVFCNVLCVLSYVNASEPQRVYDFFRGIGVSYLQFLPLTLSSKLCATPEIIGDFLCAVFDMWISRDVGRIVVQIFDEALRPIYGIPHALCVHRETCGDVAVLEHDGSFFACDHFVDREHLIGNLKERNIYDLATGPAMIDFGKAKKDSLPQVCSECEVLSFCNGGCPKDRVGGESGLNYLCSAYKKFFLHCKPEMTRLALHMQSGKSLRSFR
jgi:uncharacterized protein